MHLLSDYIANEFCPKQVLKCIYTGLQAIKIGNLFIF